MHPLVIDGHLTQYIQACDVMLFANQKNLHGKIVSELRYSHCKRFERLTSSETRVLMSSIVNSSFNLALAKVDIPLAFVRLGYWRPDVSTVSIPKLSPLQVSAACPWEALR
jgi:hypothetical protein